MNYPNPQQFAPQTVETVLGSGDRLTVTLKADGSYSAPWIVVKADTIQELADLVDSVEASGLGAQVAQAARAFEAHYTVGKGLGATPVTPVQAYQPQNGPQGPQQPQQGYGQPQGAPPAQRAAQGPQNAPQAPPGMTPPTCPHGTKTYKSGQNGNRSWQAWMCPARKGDPSQCKPEWIN